MSVLVTGATGYIGRALTERLHRDGESTVLVSRRGAIPGRGKPSHAVDLAIGTVSDELLRGVETVYHLAGIAHRRAAARRWRWRRQPNGRGSRPSSF